MTYERRSTIVVVAIDAAELTELVVTKAADLANSLARPEVHVLHVAQSAADAARAEDGTLTAVMLEGARSAVEAACSHLRQSYFGPLHAHVGGGDAAQGITSFARSQRADYIVLGTHGRAGLSRLVLGSVAEKVVRTAPCSVLVTRAPLATESEPVIEPPCADCVSVRRSSADQVRWCARHSIHHVRARLHFQVPQPFAVGSMLLRPE